MTIKTNVKAGGLRARRGLLRAGALAGLILVMVLFLPGFLMQQSTSRIDLPRFQRLTFRRGAVVNARFAPGGQTIAYSAFWDEEPGKIFTMRTDSPESRPLELPPAILHSISPKGEMVVGLRQIKDGTLVGETLARVPLAGGAPLPLLKGSLPAWADWAPDAETLALLSDDTEGARIEYPRGNVIWRSDNDAWDLRVAPAGDTLAFCEIRGSSEQKVMMIDRAGKVLAQSGGWSLPPFIEWMPRGCVAWAPDGKEVWFAAARPGGRESGLYAMTRSGEVRPLLRVPGELGVYDIAPDGRVLLSQVNRRVALEAQAPGEKQGRDLSWFETSELADLSRDGRRILFTESGQGGGERLSVYLRGTDGSPAVRLGDGKALALSPDGRWALALSATDPRRLSLLPTGAGEPQVLPPMAMDISAAQWCPGGKELLVVGTEPGKSSRLYTMDVGGKEARPFTRSGAWLFVPSPDGTRVASWSYKGTDIYSIEGGEPRAVPGVAPVELPIQWRADGRAIYMGRFVGRHYRIDEVDLATGKRRLWKELDRADPIRTVKMTPDGKAYAYDVRSAPSTLYLVSGLR
jgi:Tol biopolymer transport system component